MSHVLRLICCASIIFNFQFSIFNSTQAQQPWNFSSLEEACRNEAYLITPPGDVALAAEEAAGCEIEYNKSYHISGPYTSLLGRKRFIRFQNADSDFRMPEAVATTLLPYLVSHSYWEERYSRLVRWTFVNVKQLGGLLDADTVDGQYCNISWLGYEYRPSDEWPVEFSVATNTGVSQTLTLRAFERLAEWGAFVAYDDQWEYSRRQAERRQQQAERDANLSRQLDSLAARGAGAARQADSLLIVLHDDSIQQVAEQEKEQMRMAKERMNRDGIFLLNIKPASSSGESLFGLEINLYNCFKSTISMIEFTIAPYNERTRLQADAMGRTVRNVRCLGPIPSGEPAQYMLDELFWDDGGRIKFMRLTAVTFHFTDGTTRTFTGYDNIMRHSLH